jgi:hypothetical protein
MTSDLHVRYDWRTADDFLLPQIEPAAVVVAGDPDDDARDILDRVPPRASTFAFHLNCTVTRAFPAGRRELVDGLRARGLRVLNAGAVDVTKREIHRVCDSLGQPTVAATPAGDGDQWVIVKTDLNFGGATEWALSAEQRERLGIGEGSDLIWKPNHYRVLRRAEVESCWWQDPRLVCERFVENSRGVWYRLFLLGGRGALCELQSDQQIKKVGESALVRWWRTASTPDRDVDGAALPAGVHAHALRVAAAIGLDFGAVDVVVDDAGAAYVIDVNTTPAYQHPIPGVAEFLAAGLLEPAAVEPPA